MPVIAAGRDSRSVALATDIRSGAQLLLDDERFDGELALDDAQRAAMRDALRADRNVTLDAPAGRVFYVGCRRSTPALCGQLRS